MRRALDTQKGIDFGNLFGQFRRVPLRQTAGNHNLTDFAALLAPHGVKNGIDAFALGALDKGAGVDDEHIRRSGIADHLGLSGLDQRPQHLLGIDKIFGTTEANKTDFRFDHGFRDDRHASLFCGVEQRKTASRRLL